MTTRGYEEVSNIHWENDIRIKFSLGLHWLQIAWYKIYFTWKYRGKVESFVGE